MDKAILFDLDEVIPLSDGIVAVLTLVDEDEDEYPPIVAARCPDCHEMIGNFWEHNCEK